MTSRHRILPVAAVAALAMLAGAAASSFAAEMRATLHRIDANGVGGEVGTVRISPAEGGGARLDVDLRGLPPGEHGFHVHQNGSCGPAPNPQGQVAAGFAAGPHWDPDGHKSHKGPEGAGHLGDLPSVRVNADGTAQGATLAARIKDLAQVKGKALMVHAGGDNYSDQPENGGGGGRVACGVIE
jgi:Cu-Zn family superoxide dismutase